MNSSNLIKKSLPHILAVVIFLAITVLYFYPVLEGKVLHTNDGTVARNAAKEITEYRDRTGKEALWTNSMFSGMPAYMISVKFTGNIISHVDSFLKILKLPIASIFLTMLGFYILLLIFRVRPWLAIAGAIAYGMSTYFFFILSAGHNTKAMAIAYMAPMIGAIYYTYRREAILGAILTTFFLSLQIYANHPQITYYAFICLFVFVITEFVYAVREKRLPAFVKSSLVLVIPVVLAVGMNFASLYTTYEYSKYSIRGKSDLVYDNKTTSKGLDIEYATQWSYGVDETMTLLIPNFKGGANIPFDRNSKTVTTLKQNNAGQYASGFYQYWGTQPWTDGPVYVGAIVVFLFVLGLVLVKGPEKWWLLVATILSIMLAWGKNFLPLTNLFMNFFPGYNKFRAVTMTLVIAEFCMPLLAVITLRDILEGTIDRKQLFRGLKIALGVTGGLTLIFLIFPGIAGNFSSANDGDQLPEWLGSAMKADRISLLRNDAFRSLVFIILASSVILGFVFEKIKKEYAIILLGLLFLIDMFGIDKRYLNSDKFVNQTTIARNEVPSLADKRILEDKTDYRVLSLAVSTFSDASVSQYHKSIGGYNGAKLRRYQEMIDTLLAYDLAVYRRDLSMAQSLKDILPAIDLLKNNQALRMLNTKYFIVNPQIDPVLNEKALGNAWFAGTVKFATNANEELSLVKTIDPANEAVIESSFKKFVTNSTYSKEKGDTIALTSYQPNELIYKYNASGERLAIFSEVWYPAGWKAFIDGKPADYLRANWILRGMIVPGGSHEIRFSFEPASFRIGNAVSTASSIIFILIAAGYAGMYFVNSRKKKQDAAS